MTHGKISGTARIIAAATLLLEREAGAGGVRPAPGAAALCERFLSGTTGGRWLAASVRHAWGRRFWRLVERLTHPGIIGHYWRRKHRIEALCREAIGEGFSRVIVFGAGFDTLAWRLSGEFPGVDFIEADFPGIVAVKSSALAKEPARKNFRIGSPDTAFDSGAPGARTLVIVEGVLMYFDPGALDAFFARCRAVPAGELRIVFTFMTRYPDGSTGFRPRSRLVDLGLRFTGEPFLWACAPESIDAFLAARGFRVRSSEPLSASPEYSGPTGENLTVADRENSG